MLNNCVATDDTMSSFRGSSLYCSEAILADKNSTDAHSVSLSLISGPCFVGQPSSLESYVMVGYLLSKSIFYIILILSNKKVDVSLQG